LDLDVDVLPGDALGMEVAGELKGAVVFGEDGRSGMSGSSAVAYRVRL
jgi:hypothetical protein